MQINKLQLISIPTKDYGNLSKGNGTILNKIKIDSNIKDVLQKAHH